MSETLLEVSRRADVFWAAVRWSKARMAMISANMKHNNRALLDELSEAEDALSKAVEKASPPNPQDQGSERT